MGIGELLREIRGKDSLRTAGEKTGLSHSFINLIEKGIDPRTKSPLKPSPETLKAYADGYKYPYEKLMEAAGYLDVKKANDKDYALTPKEERDIAKDLERILSDLESEEALAYNGEPMDEETKRLMQISLENSMRLAKEMAKKKFTPNKYKK